MITQAPKTKRPSLFLLATEIGRALTEASVSVPFRTLYSQNKSGDGHPVLVLPGFMASDNSTVALRSFIDKIGYNALPWELGRNYANIQHLGVLVDKIEEIYDAYGEQISLVGWSLGGVFARQIAKQKPDLIRQIITLGSPFRGVHKPNNVAWIYNQLVKRKTIKEVAPELVKEFPKPAPVPTTAIYTKGDGVVPWQLCLEHETYFHQNIQVRGSHLGLGFNPAVLRIITDRLQYQEANWVQFSSQNLMEDLVLYPSL
jgi:pimeloyl-ACP methyl ester carboxylesterase